MQQAREEVEKALSGLKLKRLSGITPDLRNLVSTGMGLHKVNEFENIVLTYERDLPLKGSEFFSNMQKILGDIAKRRQVEIAVLKKAPEGKLQSYVTPEISKSGTESVSNYVPKGGVYRFAVIIWKKNRI